MSKGSSPRPLSVDHKTYGMRWEAVFRPRMQETPPCPRCGEIAPADIHTCAPTRTEAAHA